VEVPVAVGSVPTVRRRQLGRELRRLREERRLLAEDVAERLGCSISRVSRLETARIRISPGTVHEILDVLEVVGPQRDKLVQLARDADAKPSWQTWRGAVQEGAADYLALEIEALSVRSFEGLVVHGLLQTEGYLRALARYWRDDNVDLRLKARKGRQERLYGDDPLALHAILDEAALRRVVGGPEVMAEQCAHLVRASGQDNVTIQVVPFSVGVHANLTGPFGLLRFADPHEGVVVCLENNTAIEHQRRSSVLARYEETFARLTRDALSPEESTGFVAGIAAQYAAAVPAG
jgi:transcriptional regulator with XRE-family HTH domain